MTLLTITAIGIGLAGLLAMWSTYKLGWWGEPLARRKSKRNRHGFWGDK